MPGAYAESPERNEYMSLFHDVLCELDSLKQNLIKIDRALDNAPEGTLRLSPGKNGKNYFYIQYSDDKGKIHYDYLSNKKQKLISSLAQKSYYRKLRPLISNECRQLEDFLKNYDPSAKGKVYSQMGTTRQELVRPMYLSVEDIVNEWLSEPIASRSDAPWELKYDTDRGEMVRCAAHAELANLFFSNRHKLLYRYEAPLTLSGGGVCYPTFTLLNLSTGQKKYWEHIVLNDSSQSIEELVHKMNMYCKANLYPGENLILTFDTPTVRLDTHVARLLVKHFFNYKF